MSDITERVQKWIEERFGTKSVDRVLRPIPNFSFRPDYWMGSLLVLGFIMQGITGFLLLLYYVPTPSQAWASTNSIVTSVPYGSLLLTFHLYDAYAIILIVFLHMFRNFFVGAYKKPREGMWFYGVILGLITLGFGFTGYLLPWTVVSKSATDVGVGMLNYFPAWLTGPIKSILVGNGTDAAELTRFFAMHIILLPLLLALFLFLKLYTFEVHGIAPPVGHNESADVKSTSWMPGGMLYLLMLGLFYVGGLLIVSSLFPATLPPAYSVQAAMSITPEPDWYFLWIYQVLKLSVFGGPNVIYALTLVTLLFAVLFLVPVIDMRGGRAPSERPVVFTLGMIVATSVVFMTVWAYLTPGQTVPFYQAVMYIGGIALIEGLAAYLGFRRRAAGAKGSVHPSIAMAVLVASLAGASASLMLLEKGYLISVLLIVGFVFASMSSLSKIERLRKE
ncbi:MAG: cytochrome b [Nitrososphaeria archaeon]